MIVLKKIGTIFLVLVGTSLLFAVLNFVGFIAAGAPIAVALTLVGVLAFLWCTAATAIWVVVAPDNAGPKGQKIAVVVVAAIVVFLTSIPLDQHVSAALGLAGRSATILEFHVLLLVAMIANLVLVQNRVMTAALFLLCASSGVYFAIVDPHYLGDGFTGMLRGAVLGLFSCAIVTTIGPFRLNNKGGPPKIENFPHSLQTAARIVILAGFCGILFTSRRAGNAPELSNAELLIVGILRSAGLAFLYALHLTIAGAAARRIIGTAFRSKLREYSSTKWAIG